MCFSRQYELHIFDVEQNFPKNIPVHFNILILFFFFLNPSLLLVSNDHDLNGVLLVL